MTALDTAKDVLAKASLLDPRMPQPDINVARAWAEVLGDVDRTDALAVITEHYKTAGAARILPGDILERVRKIRADRVTRHGNSEPDYDGDDVQGGLEAIREHRRAIADGRVTETQPAKLDGPRREDVARLVQQTARSLPRIPRVDA